MIKFSVLRIKVTTELFSIDCLMRVLVNCIRCLTKWPRAVLKLVVYEKTK